MNFFEKLKIARLLMKTMTLQRKAPEDIHYHFEYSGNTNKVEFWKFRKGVEGEYIVLKRYHCYLEEDFGLTLDAFARQIAIAEKEN